MPSVNDLITSPQAGSSYAAWKAGLKTPKRKEKQGSGFTGLAKSFVAPALEEAKQKGSTAKGVTFPFRFAAGAAQDVLRFVPELVAEVARKPTEKAKPRKVTNPVFRALLGDQITPPSVESEAAQGEYGKPAGAAAFISHKVMQAAPLFSALKLGMAPRAKIGAKEAPKAVEAPKDAAKPTSEPVATPEKPLPTPNQAKRQFKTEGKGYRRAVAERNAEISPNQQALFPDRAKPVPKPPKAPEFKNVLKPAKKPIVAQPEGAARFPAEEFRSAPVKERPALAFRRETLMRNIEDTFGKAAGKVKAFLAEPITESVTQASQFKDTLRRRLDTAFKELKIKRGSPEDYAAADLIEGKITPEDLAKKFPNQAERITQAAEAGRAVYRDLLTRINAVLESHGYKPIPERPNYVTHTQQIQTWAQQFGSFLNGKADTLPSEIAGINIVTKPGRQFFRFGQKRMGGGTHKGLINSLDAYIDPAANQIYLTGDIQRMRATMRFLQKQAEANPGDKRLSTFIAYLDDEVNRLSGKKNIIDRPFERYLGRRILRIGDALRKRTGANMVGGSFSSAVTNFIPLTQSLATTAKPAAIRGLVRALTSPFKEPYAIDGVRSGFLTRRFPREMIGRTAGSTTKAAASWFFRAVDRFSSNAVVAGKFYEGVGKGLAPKAAMKLADDYAARVLADRSFAQSPLLFDSKVLGAFTQFQLEINNMLSFVMKDIPKNLGMSKAKSASSIVQFMLYSYAFNELYEKIVGRRPQIDPIHAVQRIFALREDDAALLDYLNVTDQNSPAGELVQNLPFVSTFTGGRIPIEGAIPDIPGLLAGTAKPGKELAKPLYYLLPPTGGGQAKKIIEGTSAYQQGGSYKSKGKPRYYIDQTPANFWRTLLFGQYATPEARRYFEQPK